ncbi:hypothetical protein C7447_101311 [Tenacibaculum adriaticum]|uniref:Uncharacterized protein n=1 Tax=Tenacibaculum adriaticum TaxID=413713 RepID=A0A5S5DUW1_9FLAO|nr:DUF6427 family protein [Tenacibaculum adriaticum]TYP99707.1 hypothetical protein C7447_101311 [Tenacibaculum adriaticum]
MLTNFFSKSKPITVLLIIALFLCYYFMAFLSGKIASINLWVLPLFLLMFSIAGFINSKNALTFDNSYAFLFLVFFIGMFPETLKINSTFYSNLTLLLFLRKVYSIQSSKNLFKKLFDGGLWLGITFLIEPFSIQFGILLYISIYLHQRFTYQTILIPLIGFFAPTFLYFTYCLWYDKLQDFELLFDWFTHYDLSLYNQFSYLLPIYFVCVFIMLSVFFKTPKALAIKNSFRKNWILLLLNFAIAFLLLILVKDRNGSEILYLFFPSALIIANGLELFERKWFIDVVPFSFIVCAFIVNFV